MDAFYAKIDTNRTFVKELLRLFDIARKLNIDPHITFYNLNGENMELQLYDAKFTSKKRKGIEAHKTYMWLKTLNTSRMAYDLNECEKLSLSELITLILSDIPEGTFFDVPAVFNETSGSYYKLIGVGFDQAFNAAFWCEKIR